MSSAILWEVEFLNSQSKLEKNKEIVKRFVEAFNKGRLEQMDELFQPEFNFVTTGYFMKVKIEGWKKMIQDELNVLENINWKIEEMVSEGDLVGCPVHLERNAKRHLYGDPFHWKELQGNRDGYVPVEE